MPDSPLRRRIAPSIPLKLDLKDDSGTSFVREFRLCFDFNTCARIKDKTGVSMLNFIEAWSQILDPRLVSTMFWAAALAHSPEYNTKDDDGKPTDDGLECLRSYMDDANSEQICEALWQAYLLSLSKDKREAVEKLRASAERKLSNQPIPPAPLSAVPAPTMATNGSDSGQLPATTSDSALTSSVA